MRTSGVTDVVVGLHSNDHLCWPFDDFAEFRARAAEFLADGLQQGQRACYVAHGDDLVADLATQPVLVEALRDGRAEVISLESLYGAGPTVTPEEQVSVYATATLAAIEAGFTGLRVAADATALVRTPDSLDAFCRYEHLIDRYTTAEPFSAMCAYHRPELPEPVIARLAALHPVNNAWCAPFRLHATVDGLALDGEVDWVSSDLLALALESTRPENGELRVDATGLRFIDHHGLLALHEHARANAARLVLRSGRAFLARLVSVLELDDVECVR
ncbi:MEDS domain-containing protein [Lentzea sp. NPDC005914]|uniref:MEDS domain-containing protein n=1 Tax=Lentzea sp. NPDC005914 TaxID=3154572 RepID=UPI0033D082D8